jgi:hypothetical protein
MGGLLVFTGKMPPGFDIVQAIKEDREERINHIFTGGTQTSR